jgi:predicted Zn finger-like uncharacterized protein
MVEIQCSSCHTRYRIDERVLPEETPTFKCSRCGHVFSVEPRASKPEEPKPAPRKAAETKSPVAALADKASGAATSAPASAAGEPTAEDAALKAPGPKTRRALKIVPPAPEREAKPKAAASAMPEGLAAPGVHPERVDPLARSFSDHVEDSEAGENLSFDFSTESEEHVSGPDLEPEDDKWEVGENPMDFPGDADDSPAEASAPASAPEATAPRPSRRPRSARALERERQRQAVASMPSLGRAVHSFGLFLAWFFFVALAFGALSLVIAGEPTASAAFLARLPGIGDRFLNPLPTEIQVALREVSAQYQSANGGRQILVITGQALNVGSQPLHEVQIAVRLLDSAQQELASQSVYCGNDLSGRMINQMTTRELDFFQRLGPPKAFVLPPSGSYAFVIVFTDLPPRAGRFAIEVERATPAAALATAGAVAPGAVAPGAVAPGAGDIGTPAN